jgi:hypothetical protein
MSRETDKRAHRSMATWGVAAIVGDVIAFTGGAPGWLRLAVGLLSLVMAFFAGLVAIPS